MNEINNSEAALEWIVKDLSYVLTHLDHCIAQSSKYPALSGLKDELKGIREATQAIADDPMDENKQLKITLVDHSDGSNRDTTLYLGKSEDHYLVDKLAIIWRDVPHVNHYLAVHVFSGAKRGYALVGFYDENGYESIVEFQER